MSKAEWWVLAVLRGVLFLGSAFCALVFTAGLAYSGSVPVIVLYAVLSMAPAAIVCWVLTATKGGDWWTFGYVAVGADGITVAVLRDLIVSTLGRAAPPPQRGRRNSTRVLQVTWVMIGARMPRVASRSAVNTAPITTAAITSERLRVATVTRT